MDLVRTPNDHRGVISYSNGTEILRIYTEGAPPMDPAKSEAGDKFGTETLPEIVKQLVLFRFGSLSTEDGRTLLRTMRDNKTAANAFEKLSRISGQAWMEAYNGAIEGLQAARFGDRRYENRVAEFLSLVEKLFPALYQAAEDAALEQPAEKKNGR